MTRKNKKKNHANQVNGKNSSIAPFAGIKV